MEFFFLLLGLASVVLLYLVATRPLAVLTGLLLYFPLEPWLLHFLPDTSFVVVRYFPEVVLYALVARAVWHVVREKKLIETPLALPLLCLIAVGLLSWLFNLVPVEVALIGLRQIFRFILLYFVVVALRPDENWMRGTVKALLGLALLESVLGVLQAIIGAPLDNFLSVDSAPRYLGGLQLTTGGAQLWDYGTRVFGTLGRYDQLGSFLSLWLLVAVGLWYELRIKNYESRISNRWTLILNSKFLILLIGLIALVLTYSRLSWFGFLAGLAVIGWFYKKDVWVKRGFVAAAIVVALLLGFSQVQVSVLHDTPSQTLSERFFEVFSRARWEGEFYGLGRLYFMVATPTKIVPLSPVLGVGPGQYGGGAAAALHRTTAYDQAGIPFGVYGTEGYIDNNWFSLWGELGTLGLIVYIWLLVRLFRQASALWKKSQGWVKGLALSTLGVIVAFSVEGLFGTYFEVRTLAPYVWILGGMVTVLSTNHVTRTM